MFEVGFSEMLLVMLVALLVFGPERLPRVMREVGLWVRKARQAVTSVQAEINHELHIQDLHAMMKKDASSWQSGGPVVPDDQARIIEGESTRLDASSSPNTIRAPDDLTHRE